jgi:hypothetical protein
MAKRARGRSQPPRRRFGGSSPPARLGDVSDRFLMGQRLGVSAWILCALALSLAHVGAERLGAGRRRRLLGARRRLFFASG